MIKKRKIPRISSPKQPKIYSGNVQDSAWGAYGGCDGFGCQGPNCTGYKHRPDILSSPWAIDKPLSNMEIYHAHLIQPWSFKIHLVNLTFFLKKPEDYQKIAEILINRLIVGKAANKTVSPESFFQDSYKLKSRYRGFNDSWEFAEGLTFASNPLPTGGQTHTFADNLTISVPFSTYTGGQTNEFEESRGETTNSRIRSEDSSENEGGSSQGMSEKVGRGIRGNVGTISDSQPKTNQASYCTVEILENICHGMTIVDWIKLIKDLEKIAVKIKCSRFIYIWFGVGITADTIHVKWDSIHGRCKTKVKEYSVDNDIKPTRVDIGNPNSNKYLLVEDLPRRGANFTFQLRNDEANTCWNKLGYTFSEDPNSFDNFMKKELTKFVDFVSRIKNDFYKEVPKNCPLPGWDEFTGRYPVYTTAYNDAYKVVAYLDYHKYPYPLSFVKKLANGDCNNYNISYSPKNNLPLDSATFYLSHDERMRIFDFLTVHRYPYPFIFFSDEIEHWYYPPISVLVPPEKVKPCLYHDLDLLNALAETAKRVFNDNDYCLKTNNPHSRPMDKSNSHSNIEEELPYLNSKNEELSQDFSDVLI